MIQFCLEYSNFPYTGPDAEAIRGRYVRSECRRNEPCYQHRQRDSFNFEDGLRIEIPIDASL